MKEVTGMFSQRKVSSLLTIALLLLTATAAYAQVTPSVTVSDQAIENGTVTVDQVVSDGQGWIVIHAQQDGAPGPVIGHAAVQDGENNDVSVQIDVANATDTLYAMLHTDAGQMGTYEFPGADTPVQVNGQVVVQPFAITGGLEAQPTATPEAQPETLPQTGGTTTPWTAALLVVGGALAAVGGVLLFRTKETQPIEIYK
jgi:LPXTG-motif cell wall-anchored protein